MHTPSPGYDLRPYNSFHVPAWAERFIIIDSETALEQYWKQSGAPELILGGGSNLLLVKQQLGTVWLNRLLGREIVPIQGDHIRIRLGAGEKWDQAVAWSLAQGAYGLENLSLIPGSCGAAPIQNIGAYGVEIASFISRVNVFDFSTGRATSLTRKECDFAYRHSLFRSNEGRRYFITSIELDLPRLPANGQPEMHLDYPGLRETLRQLGADLAGVTPTQVRAAIIQLRRSKLPDPEQLGNAGSFFKNPIISPEQWLSLCARIPEAPHWPQADGRIKLSAAWLIQSCGLKGYRVGDAAVHAQHALVLVNHGNATGHELWNLAQTIQAQVFQRYAISLEAEPLIILGSTDQNY